MKCFAAIPFLPPRSTLHARYRFKCFFSRSPPLSCSTYVHVHTLPSAAYVEQGPFYTRVCTSFGLEAILPSRNRNQFQKSPNPQFASFVSSSFFKNSMSYFPPRKLLACGYRQKNETNWLPTARSILESITGIRNSLN